MARTTSTSQKAHGITDAFGMMCELKPTKEIIAFIMNKYSVTSRTAEKYIVEATEEMTKQLGGKRKHMISKAIHQREHVISKLMDGKQYAMVAQTLADMNKLQGFYEDEKADVNITIEVHQD